MTALDDHISHEALMAAFADINRLIEHRRQHAESSETAGPAVDVGQQ